MVTIVVTYLVHEGCESQAEAYMRDMTRATRAEAGCTAYVAHRSLEHPRTYCFYETYASDAALEAHRTSPHFERLVKNGLWTIVESRTAARYEPFE